MSFTGQASMAIGWKKCFTTALAADCRCSPTGIPSITPITASGAVPRFIARVRNGVVVQELIRKPSPTITTSFTCMITTDLRESFCPIGSFVEGNYGYAGDELSQTQTSNLTIRSQSARQFPLRVRIPGWCKGASLSVNGQRQSVSCAPGTWATLDRKWNSGDKVSIDLPMEILYDRSIRSIPIGWL